MAIKIEKCVSYQLLLQYFYNHSFVRHDQSAFRKGHSTGMALHKLEDDLLDNINEGMINNVCFFILKNILLLFKLQNYGVENNDLLWFTDFLSDRPQAGTVDACISSFTSFNIGVPQGSVLDPLLFLIFVYSLYY